LIWEKKKYVSQKVSDLQQAANANPQENEKAKKSLFSGLNKSRIIKPTP